MGQKDAEEEDEVTHDKHDFTGYTFALLEKREQTAKINGLVRYKDLLIKY